MRTLCKSHDRRPCNQVHHLSNSDQEGMGYSPTNRGVPEISQPNIHRIVPAQATTAHDQTSKQGTPMRLH